MGCCANYKLSFPLMYLWNLYPACEPLLFGFLNSCTVLVFGFGYETTGTLNLIGSKADGVGFKA